MEILNILINPLKCKSTCFLCFKHNDDTTDVSQKLYICDENQLYNTTLSEIMKYLFPDHEILFNQACFKCSSFLLQAFIMLKKHSVMRCLLNNIISILSNEIRSTTNVEKNPKHYVKFKLPILNKASIGSLLNNKYFNEDYQDIIETKEIKLFENDENVIDTYEYCKKCDMKFLTKKHLREHNKMTHENSNNAFICEFCGKDCKKPGTLKAHLNCHKEKCCPHCGKILKSHCHYKVHVKNHESHVKKPSRHSQYSCDLCPYKSFNKNSLQAHINKIHLRTRPFVCEICSKGFYKKSNMTEHLITHRNEKNLTCERCGDSFVSKKTLTEHARLHSGEKPFQCEICNLSFVTSGRRSDHFKRKHLEKMICCLVCEKKFSLKKELNAHMKKVHCQSNSEGYALITANDFFDHHYAAVGNEELV